MHRLVLRFAILSAFTSATPASLFASEVYSGEPLGEALHDLSQNAVLIAHDKMAATPLTRSDVFRLRDGRLLAITSRARKLGEPYTIETLRVTSSAQPKLLENTPKFQTLKIPDHP
jgi:hypothetical protein